MDDQTIKNVLKSLNETDPVYLKIIHLKCLTRIPKLTNKDVGKKIALSENAVYQKETQIRLTLASHSIKYPSDEVCVALSKYFTPYPDFKPIEEPKESVPAPIADTSPGPTPTTPPASVAPPRTPPSTSRPTGGSIPEIPKTNRSKLPFILAGVGIAAIILAGWIFRVPEWLWPERQERQAEVADILPNEVTRIVEVIVEVTRLIEAERIVTVPPVEVTRLVEVIATVPIERQVEVTRLATVEVPVQVEITRLATVEVPVTVEVTPVPPTPTPLPQTVIISEDFDDGEIDPAFEVIGDPVLVGGQLTVVEGNWLELRIGDETWRNYTIEYDAGKPCNGPRHEVSVRRLNSAQELVYIYNCGNGSWQSKSVSSSFGIPASNISTQPRIRIWLEDNTLYQENGSSTFVYTLPNHETGGVAIRFSNGWIDNLVITRND